MKGLIKKDLLMLKNNLKFIAIVLVVFGIFEATGENDGLAFLPVFIGIMMFTSMFSYDEYNKWDVYAISFPTGRKTIVKAKYLATLLILFLTIFISTIALIGIELVQGELNISYICSTMMGCLLSAILLQSIMYPIIFKFGIEKARLLIFVLVFGLGMLITFLVQGIDFSFSKTIVEFINRYFMIFFPILVIILEIISYSISQHLFLQREF